jgi:hypothetical protein
MKRTGNSFFGGRSSGKNWPGRKKHKLHGPRSANGTRDDNLDGPLLGAKIEVPTGSIGFDPSGLSG